MEQMNYQKRDSIQAYKLNQLLELTARLTEMIDDSYLRILLSDVYESLLSISNQNMKIIPDEMKLILLDRLCEVKIHLARKVFLYYTDVEFDVTEDSIKIMREVVKTTFENGGG